MQKSIDENAEATVVCMAYAGRYGKPVYNVEVDGEFITESAVYSICDAHKIADEYNGNKSTRDANIARIDKLIDLKLT